MTFSECNVVCPLFSASNIFHIINNSYIMSFSPVDKQCVGEVKIKLQSEKITSKKLSFLHRVRNIFAHFCDKMEFLLHLPWLALLSLGTVTQILG